MSSMWQRYVMLFSINRMKYENLVHHLKQVERPVMLWNINLRLCAFSLCNLFDKSCQISLRVLVTHRFLNLFYVWHSTKTISYWHLCIYLSSDLPNNPVDICIYIIHIQLLIYSLLTITRSCVYYHLSCWHSNVNLVNHCCNIAFRRFGSGTRTTCELRLYFYTVLVAKFS